MEPPSSFNDPMTDPWIDAYHEDNPYDSFGYHHNMCLDYVFANTNDDPPQDEIFNFCATYVDGVWGIENPDIYFTPFTEFIDRYSADSEEIYAMISSMSVHDNTKNALIDLVNIIKDTTEFNEEIDYELLKYNIITWEDEANSLGLPSEELEQLLFSASIARYSLLY